ncbi:DUF6475 domain-containing protein [Paludibacterium purpuratum]|uniref:DUF6475 domain-containing protein n=1 Tax=Paludibacterium purpuratum TaxID=1144873 RepID=A0A4R7BET2_9NEIS|nr:DUF6475 domain-containing protein [Paludibacterium purpuratum]TDR82187.1 hypothetical protein DFP86_102301 [Paludibacterium purpuratum]
MTQDDFEQFDKILEGVTELYGKRLAPFAIEIYWRALQHLDIAVFREAMQRHVTSPDNGQFMPKPADIIRMTQGSSQDKALQAWHKVDKAVRTVGVHRSVAFDDPLIHRAIAEMGGWIMLGNKTEDEWPFVAREFEQRYRAFASRQERPDYPPVLVGISEANNNRKGHDSEPPALIGDAAGAKAVMIAGTQKPLLGITMMDPRQAVQALQLVDKRDVA